MDHVVDGITAATADTEYGDFWLKLCNIRLLQVDRHFLVSVICSGRETRQNPLFVMFPSLPHSFVRLRTVLPPGN
jgi:hypothetical protein